MASSGKSPLVSDHLPNGGLLDDYITSFIFTDGRPAPPLKGQLRRKQERETLARRIVMLNTEVDKGMEAWTERKEQARRMEEHRKSLLLKPKGQLLRKRKSEK
ncbi:39S ribosomal protein L52, mitochondrial [Lampris incognitus]|uniref:39S ribosomal protein L52, mitochondrial n=1 Tax=Lampris incognitus TaxID=2546036 RepID=UPI0024B54687|nr:39S ribosomal protein L52, mitochondrial [Lampris incognitus]